MSTISPDVSRMRKGVTHSGSASFNCGDTVASTLEGWPLVNVQELAKYLDVDVNKYEHLNNGQQRMVLGARFRKMVRDQDKEADKDDGAMSGDTWFKQTAEQFKPDPEDLESTKRMREREKKAEERARKKEEREAAKKAREEERKAKREAKLREKAEKEAAKEAA